MNVHRKQFLIGSKPKQVKEDWNIVRIGEALFLSHCPDLAVAKAKDRDGEIWYLLGFAVQTDNEKSDPLTEISRSSTSEVRETHKSWAGRWVLAGTAEIHMDCSGLLGCFYTTVNGARWVSNSLAILQEIGGFTPRPEMLKHRSGIEWYPLPMTRFEGVHKLLPSQVLNLETFHIKARALPKPVAGLSYDAVIEKLEERLKRAMINASGLNKRIFTQLTAGYDSRLVLATIHSLGIKAESYTTESSFITHADATLPFKLSKAAGYRHRYIKRAALSKEKLALYDYHTARNSDDIDRIKYSEGQWDPFGKRDLILRGGIFEAGRCPYLWKRTGADFTIASILKGVRLGHDPASFSAKAFSEWMAWVAQTPTEALDWRDRFYLEQRVAGWLSAIEQSLDLTGTERFNVANCHDVISLMLTVPVEKRKGFIYYRDLIRRMCPVLLQYPFNAPDTKFRKLQKRVVRISKMPLHELYKKLKHRLIR